MAKNDDSFALSAVLLFLSKDYRKLLGLLFVSTHKRENANGSIVFLWNHVFIGLAKFYILYKTTKGYSKQKSPLRALNTGFCSQKIPLSLILREKIPSSKKKGVTSFPATMTVIVSTATMMITLSITVHRSSVTGMVSRVTPTEFVRP
jgi:hypothetical protein